MADPLNRTVIEAFGTPLERALIDVAERNFHKDRVAHAYCMIGDLCSMCSDDAKKQVAVEAVASIIVSDYASGGLLPASVQADLDGAEADHDAERDGMFERPYGDEFYSWHPDAILAERRIRIAEAFVTHLQASEMLSQEHAELIEKFSEGLK